MYTKAFFLPQLRELAAGNENMMSEKACLKHQNSIYLHLVYLIYTV